MTARKFSGSAVVFVSTETFASTRTESLRYSATTLDVPVSGVGEVVCALAWAEEVDDLSDPSPGRFDVSGLGLPHQVFEFGEHLFDGIQVRAVGRQEEQMRALGPDRGACGLALVTA